MEDTRYSIGELAERAGITRRTVRYYVQRELIPAPLGRGRGEHYSDRHLAAVLRVKSLQEQGATLDEIRRTQRGEPPAEVTIDDTLMPPEYGSPSSRVDVSRPPRPGHVWVRQVVMPGLELHTLGVENALTEPELAALARFIHELKEEKRDES